MCRRSVSTGLCPGRSPSATATSGSERPWRRRWVPRCSPVTAAPGASAGTTPTPAAPCVGTPRPTPQNQCRHPTAPPTTPAPPKQSRHWSTPAPTSTLDSLKPRAGFARCRDRNEHRKPHTGPAPIKERRNQAAVESSGPRRSSHVISEMSRLQAALDFVDDFEGDDLDRSRWLPTYLPQWSSRAPSAACSEQRNGRFRLLIESDQPPWSTEHNGGLRVSNLRTGVFSGPVGSDIGQHHFASGLRVSEAQHEQRLYTPLSGIIEARFAANADPNCLVALWMIGFEDQPDRSAEICVFEIFGREVAADTAIVGMGLHPFGGERIRDDFAKIPSMDATELHGSRARSNQPLPHRMRVHGEAAPQPALLGMMPATRSHQRTKANPPNRRNYRGTMTETRTIPELVTTINEAVAILGPALTTLASRLGVEPPTASERLAAANERWRAEVQVESFRRWLADQTARTEAAASDEAPFESDTPLAATERQERDARGLAAAKPGPTGSVLVSPFSDVVHDSLIEAAQAVRAAQQAATEALRARTPAASEPDVLTFRSTLRVASGALNTADISGEIGAAAVKALTSIPRANLTTLNITLVPINTVNGDSFEVVATISPTPIFPIEIINGD
ncbi:hypothetical protein E3O19_01610 [Cryobacterium algoritolerans]|uniref:Uncharacterized protein n=2 Tax=Cryobacterium algoritolerans TaxID=1259184 RepID=A0A4R8WZ87_9MICO|nr:hypothetical protein E3O19_01610 [Cryobacterium algoritolerans]